MLKFNTSYILRCLYILVIFGAVLFFIVIGSYVFFRFGYSISDDNTDWGQFGDYIGGVLNPIFGFLTFLGLLLTIVLQAKELEDARNAAFNANKTANKTFSESRKQTLQSRKQASYIVKSHRLSELDKAIKMQGKFIDEELNKEFSWNNGRNESDFITLLRDIGPRVLNGEEINWSDPQSKYPKHLKTQAELIIVLLNRLGKLLEVYDNFESPPRVQNTKSPPWYYTNTWRFKYDTIVNYLLNISLDTNGTEWDNLTLSLFESLDPHETI